ncbi:unnamed protein product [Gordionus sp. m RMFG-2023]
MSLEELKDNILQQKKMPKSGNFTLQIINAQNKEEYKGDKVLIPKNTSIIVARVPISAQMKKLQERSLRNAPFTSTIEALSIHSKSNNFLHDYNNITQNSNLSKLDMSEEQKIKAMMQQATKDFDPTLYQNLKFRHPPPSTYVCFKCHQIGHWIQFCPFFTENNNFENRIKRSTGIPRSFMTPVQGPNIKGALLTNEGKFAVPIIDQRAYIDKKIEAPPFLPIASATDTRNPVVEVIITKPVPKDLECGICAKLMKDATVVPCCGNSFCYQCISKALLDHEDRICPSCHECDISPGILIPNQKLRNAVDNYLTSLNPNFPTVSSVSSLCTPLTSISTMYYNLSHLKPPPTFVNRHKTMNFGLDTNTNIGVQPSSMPVPNPYMYPTPISNFPTLQMPNSAYLPPPSIYFPHPPYYPPSISMPNQVISTQLPPTVLNISSSALSNLPVTSKDNDSKNVIMPSTIPETGSLQTALGMKLEEHFNATLETQKDSHDSIKNLDKQSILKGKKPVSLSSISDSKRAEKSYKVKSTKIMKKDFKTSQKSRSRSRSSRSSISSFRSDEEFERYYYKDRYEKGSPRHHKSQQRPKYLENYSYRRPDHSSFQDRHPPRYDSYLDKGSPNRSYYNRHQYQDEMMEEDQRGQKPMYSISFYNNVLVPAMALAVAKREEKRASAVAPPTNLITLSPVVPARHSSTRPHLTYISPHQPDASAIGVVRRKAPLLPNPTSIPPHLVQNMDNKSVPIEASSPREFIDQGPYDTYPMEQSLNRPAFDYSKKYFTNEKLPFVRYKQKYNYGYAKYRGGYQHRDERDIVAPDNFKNEYTLNENQMHNNLSDDTRIGHRILPTYRYNKMKPDYGGINDNRKRQRISTATRLHQQINHNDENDLDKPHDLDIGLITKPHEHLKLLVTENQSPALDFFNENPLVELPPSKWKDLDQIDLKEELPNILDLPIEKIDNSVSIRTKHEREEQKNNKHSDSKDHHHKKSSGKVKKNKKKRSKVVNEDGNQKHIKEERNLNKIETENKDGKQNKKAHKKGDKDKEKSKKKKSDKQRHCKETSGKKHKNKKAKKRKDKDREHKRKKISKDLNLNVKI